MSMHGTAGGEGVHVHWGGGGECMVARGGGGGSKHDWGC